MEFADNDTPDILRLYSLGRQQFLSGMLENDTLFSGLFPSYSNSRARENMRTELAMWRAFDPTQPIDFSVVRNGGNLSDVLGIPVPQAELAR